MSDVGKIINGIMVTDRYMHFGRMHLIINPREFDVERFIENVKMNHRVHVIVGGWHDELCENVKTIIDRTSNPDYGIMKKVYIHIFKRNIETKDMILSDLNEYRGKFGIVIENKNGSEFSLHEPFVRRVDGDDIYPYSDNGSGVSILINNDVWIAPTVVLRIEGEYKTHIDNRKYPFNSYFRLPYEEYMPCGASILLNSIDTFKSVCDD